MYNLGDHHIRTLFPLQDVIQPIYFDSSRQDYWLEVCDIRYNWMNLEGDCVQYDLDWNWGDGCDDEGILCLEL